MLKLLEYLEVRSLEKIFITRKLPDEIVNPLKEKFEVKMWHSEEIPMTYEELKTEAKDAHALWTMLSDKVDRELIESLPNLKVISNLAVGYNNIDVEAAKEHGIVVTNTPGVSNRNNSRSDICITFSNRSTCNRSRT